jgi:DNA repair protein RadD
MKTSRYYQVEAKDAVISAIKKYSSKKQQARIIVDAAAGSGKTHMQAILALHVFNKGGRVLQISRQPVLAEQTYNECLECGIPAAMYAAKFNKKQVSQVTIGTEGTIVNGLETDFTKPFDLLIIDEVHMVPVDEPDSQFMKIINWLTDVAARHGRIMHIATFTGSPFRGIQHLLNLDFWQEVVYDIGVDRMTEEGYLSCPVFGYPDIEDEALDFSGVDTRSGSWEFSEKELDHIVMSDDGKRKLHMILDEVIRKTRDRNQRIIFASTKRHAREIRKMLIAMGIEKEKIGLVTDDSSEREKDHAINGSKEGRIEWLINVSCLTTGFDSPLIDVVIFLRPVGSLTLLVQCMGRGARLLHQWMLDSGLSKPNYLVLDYAGVMDRLGHLLDDPLTGAALAAKPAPNGELPLECPRCATMNGRKARRCRGRDSSEPDNRCGYFYISQTCAKCNTENDIAANVCRNPACQHELIDPNKKLLNKAYSDEEMVPVKAMHVKSTKSGAVMLQFELHQEPEHGHPYVIYPLGSQIAQRIFYNECIKVYCQPAWQQRIFMMKTAEQVCRMQDAFRAPKAIAYRINGKNKYVVGRRAF